MRGLLLFLVFGLLQACLPLPAEQGVCQTADGEINTYNVVGVWKKIPDPKDPVEMANYNEGNYRLLYVVDGGAAATVEGPENDDGISTPYTSTICEKLVTGGTTDYQREALITKSGVYFSGNKRISTSVFDFENKITEPFEKLWIRYAFSGSCGDTKLHLEQGLTGNKAEHYTIFSAKKPPENACQADPL